MTSGTTIGDLIRERRLERGYSLGQLATRVGATASVVRSWERDEAPPDSKTVPKLAHALDVDAGDLESLLSAGGNNETGRPDGAASVSHDAASIPPPPMFSDESATGGEVAPEAPADDDEGSEPSGEGAAEPPGEGAGEPPGEGAAEPEIESVVLEAEPEHETTEGGDDLEVEAVEDEETRPGAVTVAAAAAAAGLADDPTEAISPPVPGDGDRAPSATREQDATAVAEASATAELGLPGKAIFPNPLRAFFDPRRRWLYWTRTILTIVVLLILARVFAWALGELWDALGSLLDTIESTEPVDGGQAAGALIGG